MFEDVTSSLFAYQEKVTLYSSLPRKYVSDAADMLFRKTTPRFFVDDLVKVILDSGDIDYMIIAVIGKPYYDFSPKFDKAPFYNFILKNGSPDLFEELVDSKTLPRNFKKKIQNKFDLSLTVAREQYIASKPTDASE